MDYKIVCPKCGARLSRWRWMISLLYFRCRNCQARFQMTFLDWVVTMGVILLEFFWFALSQVKLLSPGVSMALVAVTCVAALVWLPYLTPVQLVRKDGGK